MGTVFGALSDATRRATDLAIRPPKEPFVVHVGEAAPVELAMAAGLRAVRLLPIPGRPAPRIDGPVSTIDPGWRVRSWIEQLLALADQPVAVLVAGPRHDQVELYTTLRELGRFPRVALPPMQYLDLPMLPHRTTTLYRRHRMHEVTTWLGQVVGAPVSPDRLADAIRVTARRDRAWSRLVELQRGDPPAMTGAAARTAQLAGAWLPAVTHGDLLDRLADEVCASGPGPTDPTAARMLLVGRDLPPDVVGALETTGTVVGDLDAGPAPPPAGPLDPVDHLADRVADVWQFTSHARAAEEVADRVLAGVRASHADGVLCATWADDDPEVWDAEWLARARERAGIRVRTVRLPADAHPPDLADVAAVDERPGGEASPRRDDVGAQQRSRKVLEATTGFGRYQRAWFDEVTVRARGGEPFAVVNADFPHELLRALDIPYVVNQWWASIVGAKRLTPRFAAALAEHGYPTTVEPYSTQGLASALVPDDEQPWGGLPRPTVLGAVLGTAPTAKIFTSWARETGAHLHLLERTVESRWDIPVAWWDELPDRWDHVLEDARLDLMRDELVGVVRALERQTGRRFDEARFEQVLAHANAQAAISRDTRDLVASARPTPAGVVDLMPATMIPQWHRGTRWAVDAARMVHDEVARRIEEGRGVVADERLRLMWVGRGFWGDTGLYQCLEASHGGVFVWSMYLALAADGYLRRMRPGQDPLRALASRFVTMGDELRMPTWAGPWHVKEARDHGVDGAVAIADADPFVVAALREAGVPVLSLGVDNLDARASGTIREHMRAFADDLLAGRVERHLLSDGRS